MARKKMETTIKRVKIYSPFFTGYLDEMPQEAKDRLIERNPKTAILFEVKQ